MTDKKWTKKDKIRVTRKLIRYLQNKNTTLAGEIAKAIDEEEMLIWRAFNEAMKNQLIDLVKETKIKQMWKVDEIDSWKL